jgi:hypothetical protein
VLDRDGEAREVGVADHLAKLLLGFEHPSRGPAQTHLARAFLGSSTARVEGAAVSLLKSFSAGSRLVSQAANSLKKS